MVSTSLVHQLTIVNQKSDLSKILTFTDLEVQNSFEDFDFT